MFPGGHPSKYWPDPMMLNFSDWTNSGFLILNNVSKWSEKKKECLLPCYASLLVQYLRCKIKFLNFIIFWLFEWTHFTKQSIATSLTCNLGIFISIYALLHEALLQKIFCSFCLLFCALQSCIKRIVKCGNFPLQKVSCNLQYPARYLFCS